MVIIITDPQINQYKQFKALSNKLNYPYKELGGGWLCLAFEDPNSKKIYIFAYLNDLDDFFVDNEIVVNFKRKDGKKMEPIYYKIPTPNNVLDKFFSLDKDIKFIRDNLEEYDIYV